MAINWIKHAHDLVDRQMVDAAVASLEQGGHAGDANCWIELASWCLGGDIVRRDLAKSRESFRLAGELGHLQARRVYIALLANGVGGPAEWNAAVGLLGELATSDEDSARELHLLSSMDLDRNGGPDRIPPAARLSESPDVLLFRALLTADECEYLIARARPLFQPSVVVDPASGQMRPNPVRTSENAMFPWVAETPAIHAINQRLAAVSGTPAENGEPLQVLRYQPGQEYRLHHDALVNTGNQRILTTLVYLNEGYSGGETLFPKTGLKVKGQKGDGLLFRNALPGGQPDAKAQHAGLPVVRGEKLIASRWIRERPMVSR